ncbi:response regulator transcription factor [Facilibium subflavum]|uniref:response regulator transcription factor n=1 Tax=Facilibium subflavum TaxID=2219058 RepID=UPI000E6497C8|nr:response regulator transcription factor [Facilibium subflavum]
MEKKQVLVVDDDREIGKLLSSFLAQFHYQVTHVTDGIKMAQAMKNTLFDIVLLDIMLPSADGFELCRQIRRNSDIPVIIISALDQESDRILGLEVGADDYLPKPFNTRELLARIKAILRRTSGQLSNSNMQGEKIICFANWRLDRHRHVLIDANDIVIALSSKEYHLLEIFLAHPQQILTRDQIMDRLYDKACEPYDRTIDVLIGRLRKKIETNPKSPGILKTIRGEGYQFCAKKQQGARE